MESVYIDGSTGEGGGQILRTSLALACITGKALHIENIRAARRNPGLARQHLVCAEAARQICDAKCGGATLGSRVLDFQPGSIRSGDFYFDIGSAGSASLVVQTVLPALFLAGQPSTVTVTGGTYNPMAPPFDFLCETFLPAIAAARFQANCRLIKPGFFPAGGGKMTIDVQPWQKSASQKIDFCGPAGQAKIYARIYTAKLPAHIAQRQKRLLSASGLDLQDIEHVEVTDSVGAGNCVMIRLCGPAEGGLDPVQSFVLGRTTIFTAFGMKGKPSEQVVGEVVARARDFLASGAAVDRFLADQILIYMALSKSGSYTTNELSTHLRTNMEIIQKFLPVSFNVERQGQIYRISFVCKEGGQS
jgi:RNA 3'-terminal phosphate cyclase (ATP)